MEQQTQPRPQRSGGPDLLRHLNKLRHGVQIVVLLFVLAVPLLSLFQSHTAAHSIQWMQGAEKALFESIGDVVSWFSDDPAEDLDVIKGSVWSARIGGYTISDPLAVIGQIAAEWAVYWPFALSALIPLAVTLLLGRVFCGWICPAYLMYEIGDVFRQLLNRAGIRPRNFVLPLRTKYAVLAAGLAASAIIGVAVFPAIYPPAIIGREWYYRVYYGAFGSGFTLLAISLVLEIGFSRRAVCRYLCPGGAVYSLLSRFRVVRLRRDASGCINCEICDRICGLGLKPMTDVTGMECNNCTACIAACPTNVLTLRLGWRDRPDAVEAP